MNLEIKHTLIGRGVFATEAFVSGSIIEICPVVKSSIKEIVHGNNDDHDYVYEFGDGYVIALGFGSMYNHCYQPNATYIRNEENGTITFVAIAHIDKGKEITINYNGDIYDLSPLWFDVH